MENNWSFKSLIFIDAGEVHHIFSSFVVFLLPRTSFSPMSGNENSPQERMGGLTEVKTCLHGVCL